MVSGIEGKNLSEKSIMKIGSILSKRYIYGGKHNLRVAELSKLLCYNLKIEERLIDKIYTGAFIHDCGKVLIPKHILNNKKKLCKEDFEIIKKHTVYGKEVINTDEKVYNNIILYHHEKYDGTGYPYGLIGDQIPIEAQIIIICDIYDALRSKRPYKEILDHKKSIKIIQNGDNRTNPDFFNPVIFKKFVEIEKDIENFYYNFNLFE